METSYLPLTEYSSKHRVSISTLRRRIKAKDIQFRFDNGKYFILDDAQRPSLRSELDHQPQSPSLAAALFKTARPEYMIEEQDVPKSSAVKPNATNDEPILTAANRLLSELKKAYTQILQEKEEQILHLKEEVTDLKTLVRVLESENERLK